MMLPAIEQTADAITLRWGVAGVPALIRYTADDGQSWTAFGVDVTGGQLTVERGSLPGVPGRFEVILADSAAAVSIALEP
jgi:hypothetical protein